MLALYFFASFLSLFPPLLLFYGDYGILEISVNICELFAYVEMFADMRNDWSYLSKLFGRLQLGNINKRRVSSNWDCNCDWVSLKHGCRRNLSFFANLLKILVYFWFKPEIRNCLFDKIEVRIERYLFVLHSDYGLKHLSSNLFRFLYSKFEIILLLLCK